MGDKKETLANLKTLGIIATGLFILLWTAVVLFGFAEDPLMLMDKIFNYNTHSSVSYTHLRAHET